MTDQTISDGQHKQGRKKPAMRCSICGFPIDIQPGGWTLGHNAQPVNNGRCCTQCNSDVVIPARMRAMYGRHG